MFSNALDLTIFTPKEREAIIERLRSDKGGWTKRTLENLGMSWPPKKGWRQRLIKTGKP